MRPCLNPLQRGDGVSFGLGPAALEGRREPGIDDALSQIESDEAGADCNNLYIIAFVGVFGGVSVMCPHGADAIDFVSAARHANAGTVQQHTPLVPAVVDGSGLGCAKVGDTTLADALAPAFAAFDSAAEQGGNFDAYLRATRAAATNGLEATRTRTTRRGRTAGLGGRSRGFLDAGAASCNLLLGILAEGLPRCLEATT